MHLYGKFTGQLSLGQYANFFLHVPSLHLTNSVGQSFSSLQLAADFVHNPFGHFTGDTLSQGDGAKHSPLYAKHLPSQHNIGVSLGHEG